ncbi:hypothetical protein NDU88_002707 [Pleurodeles waltl]|uniref:Uncharacterized protein n=1 Tax=Pleurodeles waltl TaxID=8319 RepID=A0AAV7UYI0_PLEWA|nr:hypothetical protein NDU88_002707 [Pleurodeles waltl]
MAVDVNLLRADLRVVSERLVANEQQVTSMQRDIDTLKTSVTALEVKTHKLELRVAEAEGRAHRSNLRVVGFPEGAEDTNPEAFLEDWIKKALPNTTLSAVFVVERAHRALAPPPPPGAPPPSVTRGGMELVGTWWWRQSAGVPEWSNL